VSPSLRRAAHFQEYLESILGRLPLKCMEGIGFIGVGAPPIRRQQK
jgi:hypothetical protein